MKTPSNPLKITLFALTVAILGTACNEQTDVTELSEADIALAAEIMSTSLSDNADGVIASVYDATARVSKDGIAYGPQAAMKQGYGGGQPFAPKDSSNRGRVRNATYSYDPATGIHSLDMQRTITTPRFTKSMSISLKHQFTHESGSYVVFPLENRDSVNAIYFTSEKSGSEKGLKREGQFSKIDTLSMSGIAESSEILTLSGTHNGTGSIKFTDKGGQVFERNHSVYLKLTDVSIEKATVQANQNLEEGVTGTIDYRIVTYNSRNDDGEVVVEGTIEMTGDGTALMRFKGISKRAVINLLDGSAEVE